MRAAAKEYKWDLNYGGIALMWRGGCIIRSRFLGKIKLGTTKRSDGSTEVTYLLTLESRIPMIGPMKRKANKMIIETALRELKKRVESLG